MVGFGGDGADGSFFGEATYDISEFFAFFGFDGFGLRLDPGFFFGIFLVKFGF